MKNDMSPEILLKLLSDQTRLRCMLLLLQQGELCVCELTYALDLSQPKISRHLATLRDANVVNDRRAGQWIYYSVSNELPAWAADLLESIQAGCSKQAQYQRDLKILKKMPNRPANQVCA